MPSPLVAENLIATHICGEPTWAQANFERRSGIGQMVAAAVLPQKRDEWSINDGKRIDR
jgi:hypothetical protein